MPINDDKKAANKILEERDQARKGFKAKEGGDPFDNKDALLDRKDEGEKELKERKAAAKGLKPEEGGDPIESEDEREGDIADRSLAIGLGLRRSG
jgi:hypothetical protein